jgi:hypothetical protein
MAARRGSTYEATAAAGSVSEMEQQSMPVMDGSRDL